MIGIEMKEGQQMGNRNEIGKIWKRRFKKCWLVS